MGKRGVSPLIATVVLIAFAVSLGAVVMNLGSNIAGGKSSLTEPKECANLKLNFHDLNGPQITFGGSGSSGFVEVVVDNVGSDTIPTLKISIIGNRQGATQSYASDVDNANIEPAETFSKRVPYNYDSYGDPKQVKVFPIAVVDQKKIPCLASGDEYIVT